MNKALELVKLGILSLLLGGLVLWVIGLSFLKLSTNAECYADGYKESRVSYNFDRYCVADVGLIEIVKE